MLKTQYFNNNEKSETKTIKDNNIIPKTTENLTQNNNIFKNSFPTTPVASVMGTFTPKICSGAKGKFDLPMYYFSFYGLDSKKIIYK